jgi:hypothetical protein
VPAGKLFGIPNRFGVGGEELGYAVAASCCGSGSLGTVMVTLGSTADELVVSGGEPRGTAAEAAAFCPEAAAGFPVAAEITLFGRIASVLTPKDMNPSPVPCSSVCKASRIG